MDFAKVGIFGLAGEDCIDLGMLWEAFSAFWYCLSGTLPVNISSKIKESPLKAVRGTKPEGLDLWIAPSETGGSEHLPKFQSAAAD